MNGRLPLPEVLRKVGKFHFLYKGQRNEVAAADYKLVSDEVLRLHRNGKLGNEVINVANKSLLKKKSEVWDALGRIALFNMLANVAKDGIDVILTKGVNNHVDNTWVDDAFISVVLHTGPHPYEITTTHTEKYTYDQTLLDVSSTSIMVEQGDIFIMDPTVMHNAFPARYRATQHLILLQATMDYNTLGDRDKILEIFKPMGVA